MILFRNCLLAFTNPVFIHLKMHCNGDCTCFGDSTFSAFASLLFSILTCDVPHCGFNMNGLIGFGPENHYSTIDLKTFFVNYAEKASV